MKIITIWTAILLIIVPFSIITASVECEPQESIVDPVILENLNESQYISNLEEEGFILTRFRGPADHCGEIPDNYVHLNLKYVSEGFTYSIIIQTYCNPSTLNCDFNPDDFFEQINYLESIDYINSNIASNYYKACEVNWFFDANDRIRYHCNPDHSGTYLDMYLSENKIVSAIEYGDEESTRIDRCSDGSLPCTGYIFGINTFVLILILIVVGICSALAILFIKRRRK
jgi:hypothetical protein